VCGLVLTTVGAAPASAQSPLVVVGSGPVFAQTENVGSVNESLRNVTIATVGNVGVLSVEGIYTGVITCTLVWTSRAGRTRVVAATGVHANRRTVLLLTEGGSGQPPSARAIDAPAAFHPGGWCGTEYNVRNFGIADAPQYAVPPSQYLVLGS
jgi:hypothetical protein